MNIDIKQARKQLGLTQEALAAKLGVALLTVSRWERGKARPSRLAVRQLGRLLVRHGIKGDNLGTVKEDNDEK